MEEELDSIAVDEISNADKLLEQRIREKEQKQRRLELERKRLKEGNERMMIARDREQERYAKVCVEVGISFIVS